MEREERKMRGQETSRFENFGSPRNQGWPKPQILRGDQELIGTRNAINDGKKCDSMPESIENGRL